MHGMDERARLPIGDWLLVPGWGFGASVFDELRAVLPPAIVATAVACRAAVAAIDQRAAAVRAGEGPPFGICAWSLGATLAVDRALAHPGAVAALVLVGATPRFVAGDGWAPAMPVAEFDAFAAVAAASVPSAQSRLASLCAMGSADAPALARRLRRSFDRALPGEAAALFSDEMMQGLDCLRRADLRGRLSALDIPVALVHGERDALVPAAAAHALAAALPRARVLAVASDGHALPVVQADRLAATIAEMGGASRRSQPETVSST
jgi:pimeloyl-[acyl-carrier protein] methyl ester esterase